MDISGNFYDKIIFKKYKRFLIILLICQVYKIVLTFESEFDGWLLVLKMKKKFFLYQKWPTQKQQKLNKTLELKRKRRTMKNLETLTKVQKQ